MKAGSRLWFAIACAALIGLAGYRAYRARTDRLIIEPAVITLPADGREHLAFALRPASDRPIQTSDLRASWTSMRFLQTSPDRVEAMIESPVNPGITRPVISWNHRSWTAEISFVPDYKDSFRDGTPDFLRLHSEEDHQAFRSWFIAVAETEADLPASQVPVEIDDCAALLRYCYREALRKHNEAWLQLQPDPDRFAGLSSLVQYSFPETPLGPALFRVRPGPFQSQDLRDGAFAQFADAKSLMLYNTHLVSRDIRTARPGDLIFFLQLEQNSPYHSMVVTGNGDWVVYHTGPIRRARGEMRRVAMQDLLHHRDTRWRPIPENSNFLGVFRWNILRDGD